MSAVVGITDAEHQALLDIVMGFSAAAAEETVDRARIHGLSLAAIEILNGIARRANSEEEDR